MKNPKAVKEIRAFNRFYTNTIGVVDRHILESPYSLTEVRIMYEIYHDADATARSIKRFLRVDEGYLSRTVDKLVNQGLIIKRQSTIDARAFVLALSKKGTKEFLVLNGRSEEAVESMVAHLPANRVDTLVRAMHEISELLTREQDDEGDTDRHSHQKRTRIR